MVSTCISVSMYYIGVKSKSVFSKFDYLLKDMTLSETADTSKSYWEEKNGRPLNIE